MENIALAVRNLEKRCSMNTDYLTQTKQAQQRQSLVELDLRPISNAGLTGLQFGDRYSRDMSGFYGESPVNSSVLSRKNVDLNVVSKLSMSNNKVAVDAYGKSHTRYNRSLRPTTAGYKVSRTASTAQN